MTYDIRHAEVTDEHSHLCDACIKAAAIDIPGEGDTKDDDPDWDESNARLEELEAEQVAAARASDLPFPDDLE